MGMSCKYVCNYVHRNHLHTYERANVRIMYLCMYIRTSATERATRCAAVLVFTSSSSSFVFVLNAILPFLTHLVPFSYMARLAYVLKPESVRLWVAEPLGLTKWQMHFVHTHAHICTCVQMHMCVHKCMCMAVLAL